MFHHGGNSVGRGSKYHLEPGVCDLPSETFGRNQPIFGFAEALALGFGFVIYSERNSNIESRSSFPEYTTPGADPPGRTIKVGNVSILNSSITEVCVSRACARRIFPWKSIARLFHSADVGPFFENIIALAVSFSNQYSQSLNEIVPGAQETP
jgi:hypothetical protein